LNKNKAWSNVEKKGKRMTDKERFHAIMSFEPSDRLLYWEQGFWGGTVERWYREGMPKVHGIEGNPAYGDTVRGPATPVEPGDVICPDILEAAGLDKPSLKVPVNLLFCPPFEEEVLEEEGDWLIVRDEYGIVKRITSGRDSIPNFISWPVSTREDLERLVEERLNPDTPERFPPDWADQVKRLKEYDGVIGLGSYPCGFFGTPRYLMGEIMLMMGFLDNPDLVRATINHLAELWAALYDRVLSEIEVDCIHIWEDMSYKNGPLISPEMFKEFMVPAYRKVTSVARSHGVKTIFVDTDGDCLKLIPHFMDGGVTGLYPFEVQAGMDVVEVRKAFPKLQILGGINKRELAADPERIDAELERRIPHMASQGGYIPMADHQVPPDVSWDNYLYYRRRLAELGA
jgi:uroporphyrinogen decarboxylase